MAPWPRCFLVKDPLVKLYGRISKITFIKYRNWWPLLPVCEGAAEIGMLEEVGGSQLMLLFIVAVVSAVFA